jgi:hypothetical protein
MIRLSAMLTSLLVVGYATANPTDPEFTDAGQPRVATPSADFFGPEPAVEAAVEPAAEAVSWSFFSAEPKAEPEPQPFASPTSMALASFAPVPADEGLRHSRWTIKGGLYSNDEDALDDGYIISVSWMRFFTSLFALEFELGYWSADGSDSGVDVDAWAMPIMINGRLNLPIWVLDLYGGLGIGTFYYDVDAGVVGDDDGFVLAGNIFLGATINIADAIALGLEAKYYTTDDIDISDEDLNAFAVMLTLGFSR